VGDENGLDGPIDRRPSLANELEAAIRAGELSVAYQPKAHLGLRRIVGVRAEHTGLIRPLTELMITRTLRQCRSWRDLGIELSVAVNLSTQSLLDEGLADSVAEELDLAGVPSRLLTLEITESVTPSDPELARETMHDLVGRGIRLSIDGFGSGYSSMSYLTRLPVQEVKIDQSFVLIMTVDEDAATIVQSIISLAGQLRLDVVAKGVEDARSLSALAALGCDMVQGYYLSRPTPAAELTAALVAKGTGLDRWMPS